MTVSLIDRYQAFLVDLDGVIYLDTQVVPGAVEAINRIISHGKELAFITNNSAASPERYVKRLDGYGITVEARQVMTSSTILVEYLSQRGVGPGSHALVIGEEGLIEAVRDAGYAVVHNLHDVKPEIVCVGFDRFFTYEKLKSAVSAIRGGAFFVATNADTTYPTPEGLWPGAGAILASVIAGSGEEPVVVGKPGPIIVEQTLARLGVPPTEALLVGDRLDTDILAGKAAGVDTLLVLSGVSTEDEILSTGIEPTYLLPSIAGLV